VNPLALMPYIAMAMQYGPQIIAIVQQATSNADLVTKLETLPNQVVAVATEIGAALFPSAQKDLQAAAGAMAAFDHSFTMWVQQACNMLLPDTPKLVVDGLYGPLTKARVTKLQQNLNVSVIDGWVGKLTRAAIDGAIAKITGATTIPPGQSPTSPTMGRQR